MSASVFLRCDGTFTGERCAAVVLISAGSAQSARDDATGKGWTTRRSRVGTNGTVIRDYCPSCGKHLSGGARNLGR